MRPEGFGRGQGLLGAVGHMMPQGPRSVFLSLDKRVVERKPGDTLDELNTSMFNPGGTRKHLTFGVDEDPQRCTVLRQRLERRRQEVSELDQTFACLTEQVDHLRKDRIRQEDRDNMVRLKFGSETARLKGELELRARHCKQSMQALREEGATLMEERDLMVKDNENVRQQILESNAQLMEDKHCLLQEVATLHAKRLTLGGLAAGDLSAIPASPMVNVGVQFQESPDTTLGEEGTGGRSTVIGRGHAASTPLNPPGILKANPPYNPFVNGRAEANVGNDVYMPNRQVVQQPPAYSSQAIERDSQHHGHGVESRVIKPDEHRSPEFSDSYYGYPEGYYDETGEFHKRPIQEEGRPYSQPPRFEECRQYTAHANPGPHGYGPQSCGNGNGGGSDQYSDRRSDHSHDYESGARVSGVNEDRHKLNRRSSMSAGMQMIYDQTPGIADLGVDCASRGTDGADMIHWSREQASRLGEYSTNPARRPAITTDPFTGKRPWMEWFADYVEDKSCNRWSKEEALPDLVRCLRYGAGKIAVNKWREQYGGHGTFDQLVTIASYMLGNIGTEDPMALFRKRTQKNNENHRIYGLDLHDLLHRARPTLPMDDKQFVNELFQQFVKGLRDSDSQKVACDAWKGGASLSDLFMAIENDTMKRSLLAGFMPQRTASIVELQPEAVAEDDSEYEIVHYEDDDGTVAAVSFKKGTGQKFFPKKVADDGSGARKLFPKNGPGRGWQSRGVTRQIESGDQGKQLVPVQPKALVPVAKPSDAESISSASEMIQDLMKQLSEALKGGRPRIDRTKVRCYRCQDFGHYASECTAVKPVYRGRVSAIDEREEEVKEN